MFNTILIIFVLPYDFSVKYTVKPGISEQQQKQKAKSICQECRCAVTAGVNTCIYIYKVQRHVLSLDDVLSLQVLHIAGFTVLQIDCFIMEF